MKHKQQARRSTFHISNLGVVLVARALANIQRTMMMRKRSLPCRSPAPAPTSLSAKCWAAVAAMLLAALVMDPETCPLQDICGVAAFSPSSSRLVGAPASNSRNHGRSASDSSKPGITPNTPTPLSPPRQRQKVVGSSAVLDEPLTIQHAPTMAIDLQVALLTSPLLQERPKRQLAKEKPSNEKQKIQSFVEKRSIEGLPQLRMVNDLTSLPSSSSSSRSTRGVASKPDSNRNYKVIRPQKHNTVSSKQSRSLSSSVRANLNSGKKEQSVRDMHRDAAAGTWTDDDDDEEEGDDRDDPTSRRLLTREEERDATQRIRLARRVMAVREEVTRRDRLPTELEWADASGVSVLQLRRILFEGQQAQTLLVSANVGLVTSIAKRHYYALKRASEANGGMGMLSLQDFMQEGNLGLLKAAERFEPERGWRFSTYATYWIRQRILKSISDSSRIIRLPEAVHAMLRKINKARKEMALEIGRQPSDPELAHYMQISIDQLRKVIFKAQGVVSLESPLRRGGHYKTHDLDERTIGDSIASDAPTPEEDIQRQYLQNDVRAVINEELAEREREVLVLRFGLENGEPLSARQTALHLDLTVDQVRLVETRALNKLRSPQRNYRLKEYVSAAEAGGEDPEYSQQLRQLYHNPYAVLDDSATLKCQQQQNQPDKLWFF